MIRPIGIEAVSNGWVVRVGCQQLVFTSVDVLTAELLNYLKYPEETEKRFVMSAVNIKHTLHEVNPTPTQYAGECATTAYSGTGCDAVPVGRLHDPRR